jgi:hypothetical protein
MSFRFTLSDVAKGFVDTIVREMQRPIAKAATAAVRDAGDIAKRTGRTNSRNEKQTREKISVPPRSAG